MTEKTISQKIESAVLSRYSDSEGFTGALPPLVNRFIQELRDDKSLTIEQAEKIFKDITANSPRGVETEIKANLQNSVYEVKYNEELKTQPFLYHGTCNFFVFLSMMNESNLTGAEDKIFYYTNKDYCKTYAKQWTEKALKGACSEIGIDLSASYLTFPIEIRTSLRQPIILTFETSKIDNAKFDRIAENKAEYSSPSPVSLKCLANPSKEEVIRVMQQYTEDTPQNIAELKKILDLK